MDFTGGNTVALILAILFLAGGFFAFMSFDEDFMVLGVVAAAVGVVLLVPTIFITTHHHANHHAARDLRRQGYTHITNIATDFSAVTFGLNGCKVRLGLYNVVGTYEVFVKQVAHQPRRILPVQLKQIADTCGSTTQ